MSNHNVNAAELRKAIDNADQMNMRNNFVNMLIDSHPSIFIKLANSFNKCKVVFTSWPFDKKISAIKLFRDFTGFGLAESKHTVEDVEAGKPFDMFFDYVPYSDGPRTSVQHCISTIPQGTTIFTREEANAFLEAIQKHPSYHPDMKFEIRS